MKETKHQREETKPQMKGPQLLTFRDLASLLQVSKSTLFSWISQGHFPQGIRLGPRARRWAVTDLERWLKEKGFGIGTIDETIARRMGLVGKTNCKDSRG